MRLWPDQVQRNYERISVRIRDFVLDAYLDKTTPEIMKYSTFELLSLLKYARAERQAFYHYLNVFYKARMHGQADEFKENEQESGIQYEKVTRKMFVLENIIRSRLGYVPPRVTDAYLERYLKEMKKDKDKPMIIRHQRKNEAKSSFSISQPKNI